MARIIVVTSGKGGVGKTTTSAALSTGLAQRGHKTVVIDFDIGLRNLDLIMGCERRVVYDFVNVINGEANLNQALIKDKRSENLFILPASIDLVGVEVELINQEQREKRLKHILRPLRESYHYILIDCPPSLGLLTINSLTAADSVLIPMQCEYFALEGLAQLVQTIRKVKKTLNHGLFIEGLLLTMYDRRNRLTHSVASEIQNHFSDQVYKTVIPRNVRLSESPSHGQTIIEYDANCSGAKAYRQLGGEFLKRARAEA